MDTAIWLILIVLVVGFALVILLQRAWLEELRQLIVHLRNNDVEYSISDSAKGFGEALIAAQYVPVESRAVRVPFGGALSDDMAQGPLQKPAKAPRPSSWGEVKMKAERGDVPARSNVADVKEGAVKA